MQGFIWDFLGGRRGVEAEPNNSEVHVGVDMEGPVRVALRFYFIRRKS